MFVVHPPLNMVLHVIKRWAMAPPSVIAPLGPSIPPVRWSRAASWRGSSGKKGEVLVRWRNKASGNAWLFCTTTVYEMVIDRFSPSFGGIFALLNATAIGDITFQSGSKIKRKENLVPRNSPMGSLRCVPRLIHVPVPGHHGGP